MGWGKPHRSRAPWGRGVLGGHGAQQEVAVELSLAPRHRRLSRTPSGQWQTFVSMHDLDSGELIRAQSISASPIPCLSPLAPTCLAGTRGVPRTPARGTSRAGASVRVLQAHGDAARCGSAGLGAARFLPRCSGARPDRRPQATVRLSVQRRSEPGRTREAAPGTGRLVVAGSGAS